MPNAPCKNCEERSPACHDSCEKYQAFKADRAQMKHNMTVMSNLRTNKKVQPYWKRRDAKLWRTR